MIASKEICHCSGVLAMTFARTLSIEEMTSAWNCTASAGALLPSRVNPVSA